MIYCYLDSDTRDLTEWRKMMAIAAMLLRLPDDLRDKIRWLAFKEKRTQTAIVIEILQNGPQGREDPEGGKVMEPGRAVRRDPAASERRRIPVRQASSQGTCVGACLNRHAGGAGLLHP